MAHLYFFSHSIILQFKCGIVIVYSVFTLILILILLIIPCDIFQHLPRIALLSLCYILCILLYIYIYAILCRSMQVMPKTALSINQHKYPIINLQIWPHLFMDADSASKTLFNWTERPRKKNNNMQHKQTEYILFAFPFLWIFCSCSSFTFICSFDLH